MQGVRFSQDIEAVFQTAYRDGKLPWSSVYELIVYLIESDERLYLADPVGLSDFIELLTTQDAMPREIAVALHQHPLFKREILLALEAQSFDLRSTAQIMRNMVKDASWQPPEQPVFDEYGNRVQVDPTPSPALMTARLKTFEMLASQKRVLQPKKAEVQVTNREQKEIILRMDGGVASIKKDSEVIEGEYREETPTALGAGETPDVDFQLPPRSPGQTIQAALVREAAKVLADHE